MYLEYFLVFASLFIYNSTGSALHGHCHSNEDCGTIDTHCQNETCVCKENFAVWYDSCVHLTSPRITCKKRYDCQSLGGKNMCTEKSLCACKAFHHLHLGQCVKNRNLNDICEHSHQCYCGADCHDKIACIEGSCTCKQGYKPYGSRRCIYDPNSLPIPSSSDNICYSTSIIILPSLIIILQKIL